MDEIRERAGCAVRCQAKPAADVLRGYVRSMPSSAKVFGKHAGSRRMAAQTLIAVAGVGCGVAGALSLRAAINDPPKAGDPPMWVFVGLAIGAVAFAVLAIAARARTWWALLALLASILSLVALWTLAVLFAG